MGSRGGDRTGGPASPPRKRITSRSAYPGRAPPLYATPAARRTPRPKRWSSRRSEPPARTRVSTPAPAGCPPVQTLQARLGELLQPLRDRRLRQLQSPRDLDLGHLAPHHRHHRRELLLGTTNRLAAHPASLATPMTSGVQESLTPRHATYGYVDDPINQFDLDGMKKCTAGRSQSCWKPLTKKASRGGTCSRPAAQIAPAARGRCAALQKCGKYPCHRASRFLRRIMPITGIVANLVGGCSTYLAAGAQPIKTVAARHPLAGLGAAFVTCAAGAAIEVLDPHPPGFEPGFSP